MGLIGHGLRVSGETLAEKPRKIMKRSTAASVCKTSALMPFLPKTSGVRDRPTGVPKTLLRAPRPLRRARLILARRQAECRAHGACLALRADSADQGKNIGQALVMSGTMMSSPGWPSSSFMSSSASQSWQPE